MTSLAAIGLDQDDPDDNDWLIDDLENRPVSTPGHHRMRGDAVVAWAREHAAESVVLWVKESSARAIALYQRHGFGLTAPPAQDGEREMVVSLL